MRRTLLTAAMVALSLAMALPSSAAKYYKWVDSNGVTHYDTTPPKDQQTTEVKASSRGATPVATGTTEEQAADPAAATAAATPASTADPEACSSARANLQTLTTNPNISRIDPATQQSIKLSQEEIDAAYTQAEADIAKYCEQAAG